MSLGIRGAVAPTVVGLEALNRVMDIRSGPYKQDPTGAPATWDGHMVGKWTGGGTAAVLPQWIAGQGAIGQVDFVDGQRVLRFRPGPSTGVGTVAHYRTALLTESGTDYFRYLFRDTAPPRIQEPAAGMGLPLALVMEAWMRKFNNVDPTHAVMCFGFSTSPGNDGTNKGVHIGLVGDGATGFRFGSIAAPDGSGAFTQQPSNAIDANAVQPGDLVNPALNWYHVRLKLIPALRAGVPGVWAAYLHGNRVATFNAGPTNFPRGDTGVNRGYSNIVPAIIAGCSDGAAGQQVSGFYLSDLHLYMDQDLTL